MNVTSVPMENAAMVFINDGAAWIFSRAVAGVKSPRNAKTMRMNTIAAIPMRILLGVLFFFMSVGHWRREEGEWIEREVPADEEQDKNSGNGEREWFIVLELWILPNEQSTDAHGKQDSVVAQCFKRMAMEQCMDGPRAAAARAVHACDFMERTTRHEPLDGVAWLHGVNSCQRRDQQDRGWDGENLQLSAGELHALTFNFETAVLFGSGLLFACVKDLAVLLFAVLQCAGVFFPTILCLSA